VPVLIGKKDKNKGNSTCRNRLKTGLVQVKVLFSASWFFKKKNYLVSNKIIKIFLSIQKSIFY